MTLFGIPLLENRSLRIYGVPDRIITAAGALIPIEIKSHKDIQRSDELELAFYSMLLEPYRTQSVKQPRGHVILRRDGLPVTMDIQLAPERFEEVRSIIGQVRRARREGVRPRICGCPVCSGPLRDDVRRSTSDCKDLTMIWDIAGGRADGLEELGIADYDALIACDVEVVVAGMRERRLFVSSAQVERWIRHAQSYRSASAVFFGERPPIGDSFIALDVEYDTFNPHIWLMGLVVVEGDRREHLALWADDSRQERRNLQRIADLCAEKPSLPVLTWAGQGADIPQLRNAAARLGMGDAMAPTLARHFDVFRCAAESLRLPVPSLSLGEVAAYFAVPKTSDIGGGLQAQMLYMEYRAPDQARCARLKADLIAYNLDDLEGLIGAVRGIQALAASAAAETGAP